jgi:hypothetical protein
MNGQDLTGDTQRWYGQGLGPACPLTMGRCLNIINIKSTTATCKGRLERSQEADFPNAKE